MVFNHKFIYANEENKEYYIGQKPFLSLAIRILFCILDYAIHEKHIYQSMCFGATGNSQILFPWNNYFLLY